MTVFLPGGNAPSDMPLCLVDIQYPPNLMIQLGVDNPKAIGYIFMYGRLGYMKLLSGGAHRRVIFNDVLAQLDGPLLDCSLHAITSRISSLDDMRWKNRICGQSTADRTIPAVWRGFIGYLTAFSLFFAAKDTELLLPFPADTETPASVQTATGTHRWGSPGKTLFVR